MRMMDYESHKDLADVGLYLTTEEVEELYAYLGQMRGRTDLHHVHLSELNGVRLNKELTVALVDAQVAAAHSA